MAVVQCPECGKDVSNKAKSCVHCGVEFCKTCSNCGRLFIEDVAFCSTCGNQLNAQAEEVAKAVETVQAVETAETEKTVGMVSVAEAPAAPASEVKSAQPAKEPVELKWTSVQQRQLLHDIKNESEAKTLSTKRMVYSFISAVLVIGYTFLMLWGLMALFHLLGSEEPQFLVLLQDLNLSNDILASILEIFIWVNIFLAPMIVGSIFSRRAMVQTKALNEYVHKEYTSRMEAIKRNLEETGEQPSMPAISEEERSSKAKKVGVVHILTAVELVMQFICLGTILAMLFTTTNNPIEIITDIFASLQQGGLYAISSMMSSIYQLGLLIGMFVTSIVLTIKIIQNIVVGARMKGKIQERRARLLTVDGFYSEDKQFLKKFNSCKNDAGLVLYDVRISISNKLLGLQLGLLYMLSTAYLIGGQIVGSSLGLFIVCWIIATAAIIVKDILFNDEKIQTHIAPYLLEDEPFLKAN